MSSNKKMIEMIDILNKLQDKLVSIGENDLIQELPQIAVVGSQSAGKSSVLESFVGRDFLPRGTDMVTRRPLILQLKRNKDDNRTYGKFNHSQKEFKDFDQIRVEIETETNRSVAKECISSEPINLTITSPDVLDLNLVDLPGITKVSTDNQPKDIEAIIKRLIMQYISKENCLILAVTPANQDLSTSDAIMLAREVDPDGIRTIGVLTKLDIMDQGTNARNILLNQHKIKLNRGFIGVKCRSQKDIDNKKCLSQAILDENIFFSKHKDYKDIMDKLGIENLQKYLQNQLAHHLFEELPALRDKFEADLFDLKNQIKEIGVEISEMNARDVISYTLETFRQNFRSEIGTGEAVPLNRLNGGTNINIKMNVEYPKALEGVIRNEKRLKNEIRNGIKNIFGTRLELFMPNRAYKTVVREQIVLMRDPSVKCVGNVFTELESIVKQSTKEIGRFPKLSDLYSKLTLEYLRECKQKCEQIVKERIETEMAYINTQNENFMQSIESDKDKKNKDFPMTKLLVNKTDNGPIIAGWILYNGTNYFFTIEKQTLFWFEDSLKGVKKGEFELDSVEPICFKNSIVLRKSSYNYNECEMKLEFKCKQKLFFWLSIIMELTNEDDSAESLEFIVEDTTEVDSALDSSGSGSDTDEVRYPIQMEEQVDETLTLVVAYMKTTEKVLKDALPKVCQKELIDATEKFIAVKLRGRVENKGLTLDDLIDVDPMKRERENLIFRRSQYEEALKTMDEVSKQYY